MAEPDTVRSVLLICTGNIARSQMAEAWWRHHAGRRQAGPGDARSASPNRPGCVWDVFSAGTKARSYVHPLAIQVMAERGIDIRGQHPKPVAAFIDQPFDLVVTLCASAEAECPAFPHAARREHWPFDDPVVAGTDPARQLETFRRLRDEIGERIHGFLSAETRDAPT